MAEVPASSSAQERADVLEGTLTVKNIPIKVLFDTGASRSFIAKNVVKKLDLNLKKLKTPMTVHNPVGVPSILVGFVGCLFLFLVTSSLPSRSS